jgi:uncharacterized membrane protein
MHLVTCRTACFGNTGISNTLEDSKVLLHIFNAIIEYQTSHIQHRNRLVIVLAKTLNLFFKTGLCAQPSIYIGNLDCFHTIKIAVSIFFNKVVSTKPKFVTELIKKNSRCARKFLL